MTLAMLASCAVIAATATPAIPPAAGSEAVLPPGEEGLPLQAHLDLDLAGRFQVDVPDPGIQRAFRLPRANLETGLALGPLASARFGVAAVRSTGETGYIGVDGESLVVQVELAEARYTWVRAGLSVAGGMVEDPWVSSGDAAWGMRPVAPTLAEGRGWFDKADLGGVVAWTAPRGVATVQIAMLTGEGYRWRERNEGKNLNAVVTLRPFALLPEPQPEALQVAILARDGSQGMERARSHRGAFRVWSDLELLGAGVEGVMAYGVAGDGGHAPLGLSAWAVGRPIRPLVAYVRVDLALEDPEDPDSGSLVVRPGVGVELPPRGPLAPFTILVGYEGTRLGPQAAPLAGAGDAASSHAIHVQLGVRLAGSITVAHLGGAEPGA